MTVSEWLRSRNMRPFPLAESSTMPRTGPMEGARSPRPRQFDSGTFFQVESGLKVVIARAIASLFGPRSFS